VVDSTLGFCHLHTLYTLGFKNFSSMPSIYVFKIFYIPNLNEVLHLLIQAASQATIANKKSNTVHLKAEGPFRLELDSIRMSHHALSSF